MKRLVAVVACLSVLMLVVSCVSSYEAKGDKAYSASKRAEGYEKRVLEKTAYVMYQRAVKAEGAGVSTRLRDRYVEMVLSRTHMMIEEGTAELDALPLFIEELDKLWVPEIPDNLKNSYADLLVSMADSSFDDEKVVKAIDFLDHAIKVAATPEKYKNKKMVKIQNMVNNMYEVAAMEYDDGLKQKDDETLLRAEYHAKLALELDSTYAQAKELLSNIYRANIKTYSAYISVIENRPDTTLFYKINKYDILLAVPSKLARGNSVLYQVSMYNYSYNPLRLRARNFFLEDVNGKRYAARASGSKVEPEILDQEHETTLKLLFPSPAAPVKKLVYENGDHYSEKNFF